MLRSLKELHRYRIGATDGELGHVEDFYFDDHHLAIRYVVADTGNWLPGRRVLISPLAVEHPSRDRKIMFVSLTREQVEKGPSISRDRPVSRQMELELAKHYGWDVYWAPGMVAVPAPPTGRSPAIRRAVAEKASSQESQLRSMREVTGYAIEATDGTIGDVHDFVADTEGWTIRYLVVDTGRWLPGRKVLVAPDWVTKFRWAERQVELDLSRDAVKASPPYDPGMPVNREYEVRLYDYYGRPVYWQ